MKRFAGLRENRLTGKTLLEYALNGVHLIGLLITRIHHMPDPEAVRRLLEGEIDPVEIEEDSIIIFPSNSFIIDICQI